MCDSFTPPLPTIRANKSLRYPEGKSKAVWRLIERLPESMRSGDYSLRTACMRGEACPLFSPRSSTPPPSLQLPSLSIPSPILNPI